MGRRHFRGRIIYLAFDFFCLYTFLLASSRSFSDSILFFFLPQPLQLPNHALRRSRLLSSSSSSSESTILGGSASSIGLLWEPDGYVFYCDGKEVSRASNDVSEVPQFILLTTEIQGYRSSAKKKVLLNGEATEVAPYEIQEDFVDDAFIVDFVRVYDKIK